MAAGLRISPIADVLLSISAVIEAGLAGVKRAFSAYRMGAN
jgi:hypothetical protein